MHPGWTLQINFSKPVLDLHSYNARILTITDGAQTYYLGPLPWNKDLAVSAFWKTEGWIILAAMLTMMIPRALRCVFV